MRGHLDRGERLLSDLLNEGHEPADTLCALARVSLLRPSLPEGHRRVLNAWAIRATTPRYVIARTVWIRALLAMLMGADPLPWIGRLKSYLSSYPTYVGWVMAPVLDGYADQLSEVQQEVLRGVLAALARAGGGDSELERSAIWQACAPVPLEQAEDGAARAGGGRVA